MHKIIRTQSDYEAALAEIEKLINHDPEIGTPQGDRLELLTLLVQQYEKATFSTSLPDPVEAIEFRMEQQALTPRDLIPYIGSRSKVSEILSKKRPLTLSMIRALHDGLGIPAKVLIQESNATNAEEENIDWGQFPIKEMIARGWLQLNGVLNNTEDVLKNYFTTVDPSKTFSVLYRKTEYVRSHRPINNYALAAWAARIMHLALENPPAHRYQPGVVTLDFMKKVAQLSWSDQGPLLAREFLNKNGISFFVEPQLAHTNLDGAAIGLEQGWPIIGLTLRYDRIDNFWFTLIHELVHVALHLGEDMTGFYDDLDLENPEDKREQEADKMAGEVLIPQTDWEKSPASRLRSPEAVKDLSNKLHIHPAIVAGRIRHQYKSYRVLNQFVGLGEVRKLFSHIDWSK